MDEKKRPAPVSYLPDPREKQVKIAVGTLEEIFCMTNLMYETFHPQMDGNFRGLVKRALDKVEKKLESNDRRNAFTKYKTAEKDTEEREQYRKKYLDLVEIHASFRSPSEITERE